MVLKIKDSDFALFNECEDCLGKGCIISTRPCSSCEGTGWVGGNYAVFVLDLYMQKALGDMYVNEEMIRQRDKDFNMNRRKY